MSTPSSQPEPSAEPTAGAASDSSGASSGPASLVGTILGGRYLLERLLGEGGMGAVYQAEHTHMRKRFAVKVLHSQMSRLPEVVARFEREAMAAAHIEHPNVAAATDFGKLEDGSFFLVLEYVEGLSLRDVIADGPLSTARALDIASQMASAVGRAHALGIVHRDLKPENIMLVTRDGRPDFVKVLDFGIAKVPVGELGGASAAQALTQVGMVYGTPEYMAPEQALGQQVDARADLYSLGVILFEMIAGSRPFESANKVVLLGMHVTAPIPRLSDRAPQASLPRVVETLVTKLLDKDANLRFESANALREELDRCLEELGDRAKGDGADALHSAPSPSGPRRGPSDPSVSMALGPTRLAKLTAIRARGNAASALRAALEKTWGPMVSWTRRELLADPVRKKITVTAAIALAASSLAIAAHSHSAGTDAAHDPRTDAAVSAASAKIVKGDFAGAIGDLKGIEIASPSRADVHSWLERAYVGARDTRAALGEASLLARLAPAATSDPQLLDDVRNAALTKDDEDQAFTLLESSLGAKGVDALYDLAYGSSARSYPQVAARARRSLADPTIRAKAGSALAVLLDLRDAKTCDDKHALLDRVRDDGDARVLPVLQSLQSNRGCGFFGVTDCYPCLRRDTLLTDAMSAIEQRGTR